MEKRLLWFFVVTLLATDIALLAQRVRLERGLSDLGDKSTTALLESAYADEEQDLLTQVRELPEAVPTILRDIGSVRTDRIEFLLFASVNDCTNCIEDEIAKLNEMMQENPEAVVGIQGFFVDEDQPDTAERFIAHLRPVPLFPVSVENTLVELRGVTTPLVLVASSRSGRILDAHKPIPEDLAKRDAFYARWSATLDIWFE